MKIGGFRGETFIDNLLRNQIERRKEKMEKNDCEASEFCPKWIDMDFPNQEEFINSMEVIKFYLMNSPCEKVSTRGVDISDWGKPNIVLWNRLKAEIGLNNGENYEAVSKKADLKKMFKEHGLEEGFINKKEDTVVVLDNTSVFDSVFRHIRNSIAHGRWQMKGDIYYFEDGKEESVNNVRCFSVTARIVLSKSSLLKWRDIIVNGPSEEERSKINLEETLDALLDKLYLEFKGKKFGRKDALVLLRISNEMWKKLYKKGRECKRMEFLKPKWEIKG